MTPQEHSERRLAAIMFTDMVNYSELMQKDEARTLKLLENQQQIVNRVLQDHSGQRIKTIGDAFFSQFDSVQLALNCGIKIQETLVEFNATKHLNEKINIRIGIHLGDVEIRNNDAYGDGVNIASRIESFADAGGICITEDVYRQVMNKTNMNFRSIGKKELKNIAYSPEVYKVILPWEDRRHSSSRDYPEANDRRGKQAKPGVEQTPPPPAASEKKNWTPYALGGLLILVVGFILVNYSGYGGVKSSGKSRSIAVLPFESMTDQTGVDYFSNGITEDIISALAKIEDLRVIARTSILQYQRTTKTVVQIAKELNVNTILEGSVRRIDDNVRVVAQLIDIETDDHLWAETYDRKLDDIFAVQSDIAMNIANALKTELSPDLSAELASSSTIDTRAYENYLKGKEQYYTYTEKGYREAIKYHNRALELDPNYAMAYAELGNAYAQLYDLTKDQSFSDLGFKAVGKALSLNSDLAEAHKARGVLLYNIKGKVTESLKENIKAIQLKPGYADAIGNLALRYLDIGDLSEFHHQHIKIYAINPNSRLAGAYLSLSLFLLLENEEAIRVADQFIKKINDSYWCLAVLFYHHLNSGELKEAKKLLIRLENVRNDDDRIHDLWAIYYSITGDMEAALNEALSTPNPTLYTKLYLASIYSQSGNRSEAEEILSSLESSAKGQLEEGNESFEKYYILAHIHAIRGNNNDTITMLEDAVNIGFRGNPSQINFLSWLVNPIFFEIRQDNRFIALQNKVEKLIERERIEAGFINR